MLSKVEKTICKHKVQLNNYVSALGGGSSKRWRILLLKQKLSSQTLTNAQNGGVQIHEKCT